MTVLIRLAAGIAALALSACSNLDLDPSPHHEFPKETGPMTSPPLGLLDGTSR
jgi:hypothetical protein